MDSRSHWKRLDAMTSDPTQIPANYLLLLICGVPTCIK